MLVIVLFFCLFFGFAAYYLVRCNFRGFGLFISGAILWFIVAFNIYYKVV